MFRPLTFRFLGFLAMLNVAQTQAAEFRFADDTNNKRLTILEGDRPVLTYNYGDQLAPGVEKKYARACYVHPLYDLDGKVITEDFPKDHYHHRGLFWAWPQMKARGKEVQTWHPSGLKQEFVKWHQRDKNDKSAILAVENEWILDGKEKVARESVQLKIHKATAISRAIDVTLEFEAIGGPVELFGPSYGGLNVRLSPRLKSKQWTTDRGVLSGDQINELLKWVDFSADNGLAILLPTNHPQPAPRWLLRSSYGNVICVHWPSDKPFTLQLNHPLTLTYRLYLHRGDAEEGEVARAYEQYSSGDLQE